MRLERRGSEFWAEFDDPDWDAKAARSPPHQAADRDDHRVAPSAGVLVPTGQDRLLGQLPGMYLIAERRWIPRRAGFLRPPTRPDGSETGRWNAVCINCHATHGKRAARRAVRLGSHCDRQVADTTVAEFGIACEACHGPSEQHVRREPQSRCGATGCI